ncbi:hypothetical protein LD125_00547 [Mesoplasma sp. JKS002658]|uniref:DNA cytosine methyltransferase n=2 Tax=Mesoplasma whartonense TaxID=2878854 RepID=UPI0035BE6598|nr:hypothetical protein [Mesoplasma sp. JKS002664]MCL8212188.1 hypothetical protein [Mesoplasma sp. JKS002662]MCL8212548.1 hypothetical protein [Mesoplasma sp. JKS002661]MCL8213330.1 hypothetical protein [Mesoplasma sp. JKS002660]MCL8214283.1 hypothetical protein [Mesoplasma sp. JKS002658]MCL8214673.1 hypothetical protein [Mesoplasma sp. JKS002663]MCL8215603.1 hypothetical protein [Mesoplasma sp. JKS002659]MCL8215970.1 hypothetical protein [Mesoplasma sp. JKS002657]
MIISFLVIYKMHYRFLTPRECYLLMGFSEKDYECIKSTDLVSKPVMYRQAGNSIVVNVLVAVFNYIYVLTQKNQL